MKDYRYIMALLSAAILWHALIYKLSPRLGLLRPNFRKKPIPASYGLAAFGYVVAALVGLEAIGYASMQEVRLYLGVMAPMWALGAADDVLGSREVGGFRGHFRKLIHERVLTTGAIKALGGGCVGLVAGWFVSGGNPMRFVLAALLVPLAANTINIFDLRPGRALAVFFALLGVTWLGAYGHQVLSPAMACIAAVALVFAVGDCRGRAMMGDSWSNSIGAALGLNAALKTPLWFQTSTVVALVLLQLYSEKHSLTELIERSKVLRSIDRRLGVR